MAGIYDVIIVGAGFAGLACAKRLAELGASVIVIDRKSDLGKGIHTTGILVNEAAEEWQMPEHLLRSVPYIRLYSPNLKHIDLQSPGYEFYTTDTPNLMRHLAEETQAAGAVIQLDTPFYKAERMGEHWLLPEYDIQGRYLIGADGADSRVAEFFGLSKNTHYLMGLENEYVNLGNLDENALHCFIDSELAPGYIAWAAPSVTCTQVGLACHQRVKPDMERFLNKIDGVFDFENAELVGRRGGKIPIGGRLKNFALEHMILLGDSAGLVSPLTAGGIYTAYHHGKQLAEATYGYLHQNKQNPAELMDKLYPRFTFKKWLRYGSDLQPANGVFNFFLGNPVFQAAAKTVFYHNKGLFSPQAWRDMALSS